MDPNANLKEQRRLCAKMIGDEYEVDSDDAMRLVELVQALDEWIYKGGFLPDDWRRGWVKR